MSETPAATWSPRVVPAWRPVPDEQPMETIVVLATEYEAHLEYARNAGAEQPERAWILTPQDAWARNPHYHGPAVPHPEDDDYETEGPPASARESDDIPF